MLTSKIGGSTLAGGKLKFEVFLLYLYKGPATLIDTTTTTNCEGQAANDDPCKIYSTNIRDKSCLFCANENGNRWSFTDHFKGGHCGTVFPSDSTAFELTSSVQYTNVYTYCDLYQQVLVTPQCRPCDGSFSGCIYCTTEVCFDCAWRNQKTVVGTQCTGTCGAGTYYAYGHCIPCLDIPCTSCPLN